MSYGNNVNQAHNPKYSTLSLKYMAIVMVPML